MTRPTETRPLLLKIGTKSPKKKSPDEKSTQDYQDAKFVTKSGAKQTRKPALPIACILLTELFERMTFYSISANLVLFCTNKLHFSSPDATTVQFIFTGSCYLIPVVGGWIADSISGKYNAIFGSGLLYVVGTFLLLCSSIDYRHWSGVDGAGRYSNLNLGCRTAFCMCGLGLVSVGSGGIKANIGPFGARQAEVIGPQAVQTFFQWFYFFINVGSFVAYSFVAYIQQNCSFTQGFAIATVSMILSVTCFVVGKTRYEDGSPTGSLLTTAGRVVMEGCRRKGSAEDTQYLLDTAKKSRGGSFADSTVEWVQSLGRLLPVFSTLIMYWAIDSQMSSTFFLQSVRMDVRIGSVVTPAAALNLFNIITVLILIPLLDRVVYPWLSGCGVRPSPLQRMGFGMILTTLSVICAGVLEIFRKRNLAETGGFIQVIGDSSYNSSTLSMFLQVPQFALIGASEVFTSAAGLEFAYSQSPSALQGVVMGLYFLTDGLGNFVDMAIVQIVRAATTHNPWFPHEINSGRMEYLYFLLAGLIFINFFVFLVVSKFYKYRSQQPNVPDIELSQTTASTSSSLNGSSSELSNEESPAVTHTK